MHRLRMLLIDVAGAGKIFGRPNAGNGGAKHEKRRVKLPAVKGHEVLIVLGPAPKTFKHLSLIHRLVRYRPILEFFELTPRRLKIDHAVAAVVVEYADSHYFAG